jgi:hypothetical protein
VEGHDLWHLVVLGSTLMGAAGLAILVLAPLVFDEPPPGLQRAKPLIWALVGVAAFLLAAEWLGVH